MVLNLLDLTVDFAGGFRDKGVKITGTIYILLHHCLIHKFTNTPSLFPLILLRNIGRVVGLILGINMIDKEAIRIGNCVVLLTDVYYIQIKVCYFVN